MQIWVIFWSNLIILVANYVNLLHLEKTKQFSALHILSSRPRQSPFVWTPSPYLSITSPSFPTLNMAPWYAEYFKMKESKTTRARGYLNCPLPFSPEKAHGK